MRVDPRDIEALELLAVELQLGIAESVVRAPHDSGERCGLLRHSTVHDAPSRDLAQHDPLPALEFAATVDDRTLPVLGMEYRH